MKSGLKTFLWIFSGVVIFCLALELGWDLRTAWEPQRGLRAWVKFGQEVEKLYRQDKDGGKTPEETMSLFLDALRRGDTDQASKYFILDKQDQWKQDLAKIKADGYLGDMVEDVGGAQAVHDQYNDWQNRAKFTWMQYMDARTDMMPDGKGGYQAVDLPAGQYAHDIILEKNNQSGVWKISVL